VTNALVEGVLAGRRRVVARAISLVENNGAEAQETLAALHPHTGRAHIIGVTGPPGSGKSTLVNALALHLRRGVGRKIGKEHLPPTATTPSSTGMPMTASTPKVGIIAVDPTSPFSGGAILGDRIRMRDLSGDPGIFIRSMASRGNLGGLAWATADAVKVLDAAGYDVVIVETVGAGQAEVDIARTAHTTVVVEVPGMGDDIQAIKAGILEIADVFAVNKADHEGADHAVMALRMMLDLNRAGAHTMMHHGRLLEVVTAAQQAAIVTASTPAWQPSIHKTVATRREGIEELAESILAHRAYLEQSGDLAWRERERAAAELETIIQQESLRRVLASTDQAQMTSLIEQIVQRQVDPYTASQDLMAGLEHH
jgi:LAO/AO transport system kinase